MRATRARACDGKLAHETPEAARRHLERLVRGGAARRMLVVYDCRFCPFWHVGHRGRVSGDRRKS